MGAIHKISVDWYEEPFTLIGLHCVLEDYAMGYALNLGLNAKFKRTHKDLVLFDNVPFPIFEWKDTLNERYWTLITNQSVKQENQKRQDLFEDQPSFVKFHVIPEHKEADYLLKIEHDNDLEVEILKTVQKIPKVVTAYYIEADNLKSRTNLIFE